MKTKLMGYLYLTIFLLVLLTPALDQKLHFLPDIISTEKRVLAPRPKYSIHMSIVELTRQFQAYWNDNFGARNLLISFKATVWTKIFKESPVSNVVIGKDGWLFYKSEVKDDGPGINDYQGIAPFTQVQVDEIVTSVRDVKNVLDKKKVDLVVVVAPNKSTIYSDYLPANIHKINNTTRLDQLISAMPKDINFVDLRDTLISGRSIAPTYQSTDSHWNNLGAFLAVKQILNILPAKHHLKNMTLDDYNMEIKEIGGEGDLASMMSARGLFTDWSIDIDPKDNVKPVIAKYSYANSSYDIVYSSQLSTLYPRMLIFGDSYSYYMNQYLAPYFASGYYATYTRNYKINYELIDHLKPNIVIWELAERFSDRLKQ